MLRTRTFSTFILICSLLFGACNDTSSRPDRFQKWASQKEASVHTGHVNASATIDFPKLKTEKNILGMEFVLIPAGSFNMGTNRSSEEGNDDESPRHRVTVSNPFYIGKYEVTQRQWTDVMGNNPSRFQGEDLPVEQVSWADVIKFIEILNAIDNVCIHRLPTEAEWEYAARAGTQTTYYFGNDKKWLKQYAWYADNSDHQTHPVGQQTPNNWGLHDMLGNVWEWVLDSYSFDAYLKSPEKDPVFDDGGMWRVCRGGSWALEAWAERCSVRGRQSALFTSNDLGFRLVMEIKPKHDLYD